MPVVAIIKWPGVSPEDFDRARETINWEIDVPPGIMFHVVAFDDQGLRITALWETAEDFQRFAEDRLMPGVQQLGFPGEPIIELYPTHRVFAPGYTAR